MFHAINQAFFINRQLFKDGDDRGSSLCIYHKGKPVVDLRGGFANEKELWPWQENTVTRLFSTTKGISAVVVGVLVDRYISPYTIYHFCFNSSYALFFFK